MHTARCYKCLHTSTGCTGAGRYSQGAPWALGAPPTKGCICPPGAEATCQRSDCGRKDKPSPSETSDDWRREPSKDWWPK
jgi:hypothetical protein